MRNWQEEIEKRVHWIKETLNEANAKGIVIGLSGGKDSAVVSVLCKMATDNVLGVIMPCGNNPQDKNHALTCAEKFKIEAITLDFSSPFGQLVEVVENGGEKLLEIAKANIKPRMRMTMLYALAQTKGYLVAGTGNYSEWNMGYFTKFGDGSCDFNPIADLCATDIFELGRALGVTEEIISKAPSAGLWEGQTDEAEMGISYEDIDKYLKTGQGTPENIQKIIKAKKSSNHKREMPKTYSAYGVDNP